MVGLRKTKLVSFCMLLDCGDVGFCLFVFCVVFCEKVGEFMWCSVEG